MRLKIELPRNWSQQNNPDGPATFAREGSSAAFQVSWAEYRGGKPLGVTAEGLKQMAVDFGQKRFGDMIESAMGPCRFGSFGTAVFRSADYPRIQLWFISNGSDHIMVTHIFDQEPARDEISEAQVIANSLTLGPDLPARSS